MSQLLRNRSRDAAFLCYHSIHPSGPRWLSVSPSQFDRQLDCLRRKGWHSGSEADLQAMAQGEATSRRTAFLTFDDGFADNFTTALPILQEHGFSAMFFVLPTHLDNGAPFEWPEVAEDRGQYPDVMRSLTWAQVETMAEAGMAFGSHGIAHNSLPKLSDEELCQELLDSRRRIEERLDRCTMLAYPFGHWDARVAAAADAAGYSCAFTVPRSYQERVDPLSIPRIPVDYRDDARRFALKVRPAVRRIYLSRGKAILRPNSLAGWFAPLGELFPAPAMAETLGHGAIPL
ncbi:MAG TPA: polysaccharide deacetylase family protein [Solirubrobacterales bacterium]|nr:polysaccharide deacetylase family protein [Solirubrobacterales bacterium]